MPCLTKNHRRSTRSKPGQQLWGNIKPQTTKAFNFTPSVDFCLVKATDSINRCEEVSMDSQNESQTPWYTHYMGADSRKTKLR